MQLQQHMLLQNETNQAKKITSLNLYGQGFACMLSVQVVLCNTFQIFRQIEKIN